MVYEKYIAQLEGLIKRTDPNLEYFKVIHSKLGNYISQLNKLELMGYLDYPTTIPLTEKELNSGIYRNNPEKKIEKDIRTLRGELNYIIEKYVKPQEKDLGAWIFIDELSKLQTRLAKMPNLATTTSNEHYLTSVLSNKINRFKEKLKEVPFEYVFPEYTEEQVYNSFLAEVDALETRIHQWIEERS